MTFQSGIFVVETSDGEIYVGELAQHGSELAVYSGFAGRPKLLDVFEVESISFAEEHPDATVTYER